MIETETRLRVGRGLGKTETAASAQALSLLKERSCCDRPPALVSDGWGGHREALLAVYGKVPAYKGRGRPPTKKGPQPNWQYMQVVKQRENGRVVGTQTRVIYGDPRRTPELLGEHTAYVERTNLTTRHMTGRLGRKTLGFSKKREMLEAACVWEDVVYNFARHVKTLRLEVNCDGRRWRHRSPAMAAQITDHIWSLEELLTRIPASTNT